MNKLNPLYTACLALLTFLCSSCNDWLDVNPRSQIESGALYNTEDGYKQALNGVYIKLGQSGLYGKDASMYLPETLARNWAIPTSGTNLTMYSLGNFDFTESGAESLLSSVFTNYYNAIAQLNDILANLKQSTVHFTYNNDKLIEGEALGLRAFLHLDVLRLWGPVPSEAVGNEKTIPYVLDITKDVSQLTSKTWDEVVRHIESDLTSAEKILEKYDPMAYAGLDSLNNLQFYSRYIGQGTMPKDEWQMLRQGRFNYYAVLAAKARLYHWIGQTQDAIAYARKIVDPKRMELCNNTSTSLTMYPEQIFGVENVNLLDIIETSFVSSGAPFTQKQSYVEQAFERGIHANDIRFLENRYWKDESFSDGTSVYAFYKFIGNDKIESDKRIPLIRMAEMYFILIENLTLAEAEPYLNDFCLARGLSTSIISSSLQSDQTRLTRLEQEYRKDFFGEGQMFSFYKKHNYAQYTWPSSFKLPNEAYRLPKPKGLSNFE